MLHACASRFDVTRNLKKIVKFFGTTPKKKIKIPYQRHMHGALNIEKNKN
jgi:hypothetical protein